MKTIALDVDSGKISRWVGDPAPFTGLHDRYGDRYVLRVYLYSTSGGESARYGLELFVKKKGRPDTAPVWSTSDFAAAPEYSSRNVTTYNAVVDVTAEDYRQGLAIDDAAGNDGGTLSYTAYVRATRADGNTVEAELDYTVTNSGFRE
jgi:hypothetical protein